MANQWVRLWLDMPTDPKWRTIARVSGQPVSLVMSVYVFLLTYAANSVKRGETQCNKTEDIATALDVDERDIVAIIDAMQGRVLDGDLLTGWEKRQPIREDSSTERVREFRKRNVTQCNATKRPDTDTDTDTDKTYNPPVIPPGGNCEFETFWKSYPKKTGKGAAQNAWKKIRAPTSTIKAILEALSWQKDSDQWQKDNGQYIPNPATYLNQRRWEDERTAETDRYAFMYRQQV